MPSKILIRSKAIREKCMDCCCWQQREVRLCEAVNCPIHPYRMGSLKRGFEANKLLTRPVPYEMSFEDENDEEVDLDIGDEDELESEEDD